MVPVSSFNWFNFDLLWHTVSGAATMDVQLCSVIPRGAEL